MHTEKNRILITAAYSSINEPSININSTKSSIFDKRGQKLLNAAKKLRDEADNVFGNVKINKENNSLNDNSFK